MSGALPPSSPDTTGVSATGGITASSEQADLCAMSEPYAVCTQILLVRWRT